MNEQQTQRIAEIVSEIRRFPDIDSCDIWDLRKVALLAADELEALQREQAQSGWIPCSERLPEDDVGNYIEAVRNLTARAEQAEAREKAAIKDIEEIMSSRGLADYTICGFCSRPDDDTCFIPNDAKKCAAVWRGQPQEGEKE